MKHRYLLGALALLAASPLAAQRPDSTMRHHPMRGDSVWHRGPGMMAPMMMMGGSAYAPERLLAQNGGLTLTAQQITALTSLRDATERDIKADMDKAKAHGDELRTALQAGTDTSAIKMHFLAAHQAMGDAQLARMVASVRAKGLLTDAQRKLVDSTSSRMRRGMMMRMRGMAMWRGRRMPMPTGNPMGRPMSRPQGNGPDAGI